MSTERKKVLDAEQAQKSQPVTTEKAPSDITPENMQRQYVDVYFSYIRTILRAQAIIHARHSEAHNEYVQAVGGIHQDLQDRTVEAYRTYAKALQAATGGEEVYHQCADAYQNFLQSIQQVAATQSDAERNAYQSYLEYAKAIHEGRAQEEVQQLAEKVQQSYLEALHAAWGQNEARQRAADAQNAYYRALQEAQEHSQRAVVGAYNDYQTALQSALSQSNYTERYQSAVQTFLHNMQDISNRLQTVIIDAS